MLICVMLDRAQYIIAFGLLGLKVAIFQLSLPQVICSTDMILHRRKPNGQFHIDCTRDAVMEFIEVLSVRKVPGIGRVCLRFISTCSLRISTCFNTDCQSMSDAL